MNFMETPNKEINKLDLECVIERMCDSNINPKKNLHGGWNRNEAEQVAMKYRMFLYLCFKYPEEDIVPFKELDEFWYTHILFTKKYMSDCQKIFGRYLHHDPVLKKITEKDQKKLSKLILKNSRIN